MNTTLWSATASRLKRRSTRILAIITVVAVMGLVAGGLFYTHQQASAAGAGCDVSASQGTPTCTYHGLTAFAVFDSLSADGCIETYVDVLASQGFETYPAFVSSRGSGVQLFIDLYDNCNQVQLDEAFGQADNVDFTIDKTLNTATLNATVTVTSYDSPDQATYPVTVNLAWQGYGAITHTTMSSNQHTSAWTMNTHFNGDNRSADATGTVASATIANYAPAPATTAYLENATGGEVYLTR
jgi:hypothetical protein